MLIAVIILSITSVACLFGWYQAQLHVVEGRKEVRRAWASAEKSHAEARNVTSELANVYRWTSDVLSKDNTATVVEKIGEALAKTIAGPAVNQPVPFNLLENMDPNVPVNKEWRPDIELDGWMENPDMWPSHGGWVNPQSVNGEMVQGEPEFQAGVGGMPPTNLDET